MFEKLKLNPGILALSYAASEGDKSNAIIRPIVPVGFRHVISLMFEPGNVIGALARPGELCVIRCCQTAVLGLEIVSSSAGTAPMGGIKLTYLVRTAELPNTAPVTDIVAILDGGSERQGRFGAWLGAATSGSAIVALMLRPRVGRPSVMLRDPLTGQIAPPGEFLGILGGFRPFSQLQCWIDDPDGRYHLKIAAEFEQLGLVQASGTHVHVQGEGANDRLLRLKVALRPFPSSTETQRAAIARVRPERIRIFRKA